jgi:hypothetical protein
MMRLVPNRETEGAPRWGVGVFISIAQAAPCEHHRSCDWMLPKTNIVHLMISLHQHATTQDQYSFFFNGQKLSSGVE